MKIDLSHNRSEVDSATPTIAEIKAALLQELHRVSGRSPENASERDWFLATAALLHHRLGQAWAHSVRQQTELQVKRANYISMEFLIGRLLMDGLHNVDLLIPVRMALAELGVDFERMTECEPEPGLGNGGLGRLSACLLDGCATRNLPCWGYGIRYEFGLFKQAIHDGWQREQPDNWLRFGYPWELIRPEAVYPISFYGRVDTVVDQDGKQRRQWVDCEVGHALAHDIAIAGYRSHTVNTLRLWSAHGGSAFDLGHFNAGEHLQASERRTRWEDLSRVLYPDDSTESGRMLRFKQHYFLASSSLQDILKCALASGATIDTLPDRMSAHINDTHPVLAIVELMRLLLDEHDVEWDRAWDITRRTFSYTNHTLMPEALETWPLRYFESMLPRHLEIIRDIDSWLMNEAARRRPDEPELPHRLSLIGNADEPHIRMANLAAAGSHTVNGVSGMHGDLMRQTVFRDWHDVFPGKIDHVTNGISPRRWLDAANPALAQLITEAIGDGWRKELRQLEGLAQFADDPAFRQRFRAIKTANKIRLADRVRASEGIDINPEWLLDVQVKRIHEYKRQLLKLFHCIWTINRLKSGQGDDLLPRTVLFSGKAAPGYVMAKLIVKLIHDVAETCAADPEIGCKLKIVFLPNYGVSEAQVIIPAADLSEQISTAGTEASGTGNMKLALNGALTIGTLDGANVELRDAVGSDNLFIFGHRSDELAELRRGGYDPWHHYHTNAELQAILEGINSGHFLSTPTDIYRPIFDSLMNGDKHFLLADFPDYLAKQAAVEEVYRRPEDWTRRAIINVAHSGDMSSDRAVTEYADRIWKIVPTAA